MPGPIIPDPTPAWLKSENASVTEHPLTTAMRSIAHFLGMDNPTAQALSLMAPMEAGEGGGIAGAIQKFIKAYHGSPHDFERFSSSAIGSGEGAQAYGHGLYFAENPQTAKAYADKLSQRGLIDDASLSQYFTPGNIVHGYSGMDRVLEFRPLTENQNWAVKVQRVDSTGKAIEPPRWHATKPTRAEFNAVVSPQRQGMYEVGINANPSQFLNWDATLSQQHPEVQRALADLEVAPKPEQYEKLPHGWNETGRELYSAAAKRLESADIPGKEAASAALAKKGIPGIVYLDQGSRAAGEGTRNYVVFNDKLIQILKKYGVLLPAAGGGGYEFAKPFGEQK